MKYPLNITLRKINTLDDAVVPQREKYPDGTERMGLMWDFSYPTVGHSFLVLAGKLHPVFQTSRVTEIIEETDERIVFKTRNSTYEIEIWKSSK